MGQKSGFPFKHKMHTPQPPPVLCDSLFNYSCAVSGWAEPAASGAALRGSSERRGAQAKGPAPEREYGAQATLQGHGGQSWEPRPGAGLSARGWSRGQQQVPLEWDGTAWRALGSWGAVGMRVGCPHGSAGTEAREVGPT